MKKTTTNCLTFTVDTTEELPYYVSPINGKDADK
jgi:hypothetical protein